MGHEENEGDVRGRVHLYHHSMEKNPFTCTVG